MIQRCEEQSLPSWGLSDSGCKSPGKARIYGERWVGSEDSNNYFQEMIVAFSERAKVNPRLSHKRIAREGGAGQARFCCQVCLAV